METKIGFEEISEYIGKKYGQRVELKHVDERTVAVTPKVKVGFVTLSPTLNLTVEEAQGTELKVSYASGFGVDMIVTGALTFLRKQIAEIDKLAEFDDKRTIRIHLDKITKLEPVFKVLQLSGFSVTADSLIVLLSFKA